MTLRPLVRPSWSALVAPLGHILLLGDVSDSGSQNGVTNKSMCGKPNNKPSQQRTSICGLFYIISTHLKQIYPPQAGDGLLMFIIVYFCLLLGQTSDITWYMTSPPVQGPKASASQDLHLTIISPTVGVAQLPLTRLSWEVVSFFSIGEGLDFGWWIFTLGSL